MNNAKSRIILVALSILLTCVPGFSLQQTKSKAPQLTTDDLRTPSAPTVEPAETTRPSIRDNHKWQRYSPEQLALSVELPGKPILLGLSFEDNNIARELHPVKTYAYQSEEVSVLIFRFVTKRSSISARDLNNLSAGFLDGSAKRPGVSDVQNNTFPKDDSTVLLDSRFREGSVMFQTRGFAHSRGNNVWLVAARFALSDESASALAFHIINSVDIP